ncbi:Pycsar system effector family protein [Desulfoluna sp.]|uniref:Pycsar system effector family protein n=1 Tax=Desulfoluna sp. TaxID=2045199 RepID=UPI002604296D|nr:Pycsar system effector family protein [Desulfoluna sp.]
MAMINGLLSKNELCLYSQAIRVTPVVKRSPMPDATHEHELTTQEVWPPVFRAAILGAVIAKQVNYVGFADKRAATVITINSFLIPIALSGLGRPHWRWGILLGVFASVLSILFAVISLIPKRYTRKGDQKPPLLHFSSIAEYTEEAYIKKMAEMLGDSKSIGTMVARDLYRMSTVILTPKFKLLKLSYISFLIGYTLALLAIFAGQIQVM